jgi:DNA primase
MMAIDPVTDEIRRRADLVEVASQYMALSPAGNERFKACCPFHDEKTPSFYISRDKGFFKCFGCGASGDVFGFLMKIDNIGFPEARKLLGEKYGVKIPERRELSEVQKEQLSERDRLGRVTAAAAHFFRDQFAGNGGLLARDYARKRGLSRETVEKFSIGYAPDNWDTLKNQLTRKYGFSDDDLISVGLVIEKKNVDGEAGGMFAENVQQSRRVYDRYRHRLMFPIWDESGRVIAFGGRALEGGKTGNPDAKYINSPETPLFHKSNILFAWHIARGEVAKSGGVIITEGYMDAIAMHEGGFPNTVATLGTALTAQHVALLRRMSPKAVYLCFDGDGAGMRAALRTAPLFAENGLNVKVVRFPQGHDPDTFIREFGHDGMVREIQGAVSLARFRLETTLASYDLNVPELRAQAMKEAAQIINDVSDAFEKEAYENFLTDTLLKVEKPTSRSDWEKRRDAMARLVSNELRADEKRMGVVERKREIRSEMRGQRGLNEARTNDGGQNGGAAPANANGGEQKPAWQPRWQPSQNPRYAALQELERKEAEDLTTATQAIIAQTASQGVLRAEKELLGVLIGQPAWRQHIFEALPLERWTNELHGEIFMAVKRWPEDEEITPVEFNDSLSEESQSIVAEIMLAPNSDSLPDSKIIDSWIEKVNLHHARQVEEETLEMIRGKIDRGEPVSVEEKALLQSALLATKRKGIWEEK